MEFFTNLQLRVLGVILLVCNHLKAKFILNYASIIFSQSTENADSYIVQ